MDDCLPFIGPFSGLLHLVSHGHFLTDPCLQWLGCGIGTVRNGGASFFFRCHLLLNLCRLSNALLDISTRHCQPWVSRLWFFVAKKSPEMANRSLSMGIFHKVSVTNLCSLRCLATRNDSNTRIHTHILQWLGCKYPFCIVSNDARAILCARSV